MAKQRLAAFALVALTAAGCTPAGPSTPGKVSEPEVIAPRLVVERATLDVGEVDYGKPYEFAFAVRNTGNKPLKLWLDRKSCLCSEYVVPDEIGPGKDDKVVLKWTPIPGQTGNFRVIADLRTNDPDNPTVKLEASSRVTPTVRFSPADWSFIDFGKIDRGRTAARELKVFSTKLDRFGLEAKASGTGLEVTREPLPKNLTVDGETPKSGYTLRLKTTNQLPPGYFHDLLEMKLTIPNEPERVLKLDVYAEVPNGVLAVGPTEVEFTRPAIKDGDERKLRVRFFVPSKDDQVEVVHDKTEPKFLNVSDAVPSSDKSFWEVKVKVPPDTAEAMKYQADGFFQGKIVLKAVKQNVEVPVRVKWNRAEN